MNPRLMTLEQMEEREANRIAFQKAKAEKAIAKLILRADKADEKEIERLEKIILIHKKYKDKLIVDEDNISALALSKYEKIQKKVNKRPK